MDTSCGKMIRWSRLQQEICILMLQTIFWQGPEFVGKTKKTETEYQACLEEDEIGTSSTYRELRAIEEGLKVRGRELRGSVVRWGCDNWAAGIIIKVGSMKLSCHEAETCQALLLSPKTSK